MPEFSFKFCIYHILFTYHISSNKRSLPNNCTPRTYIHKAGPFPMNFKGLRSKGLTFFSVINIFQFKRRCVQPLLG